MAEHGDAKLLVTPADCRKARLLTIDDQCKAVCEGLMEERCLRVRKPRLVHDHEGAV